MKQYEPSSKTQALVEKAFLSHPAAQDQQPRFEAMNEKLLQTANFLCRLTPESAEQTLMVRAIQEAHFWAKEAISKNEAAG